MSTDSTCVRVAGYDIIIVICVIAIEKRQSATYT
jgi:hypothetical protein